MRRLSAIFAVAAVCLAVLLSSCGDPVEPEGNGGDKPAKKELTRGEMDSMLFVKYEPLNGKPVTVYYYIPSEGDVTTMKVLFAMHGTGRNADDQIGYWKKTADAKGVIVIAPGFYKKYYPNLDYQYGGVSNYSDHFDARVQELWTYNIVEKVFDWLKAETGNISEQYDLWGHSAGSQFTHRFLLWMPDARVHKAITSNAGSYTFPTPDGVSYEGVNYGFPYSISDTGIGKEQLAKYFSRDLTVHLGTADVATTLEQDPNLPTGPGALAQGSCRFERGHNFFDCAKHIADSLGVPFNWKLVEVPNVAHSAGTMVKTANVGAAALMYQ